MPKPARIRGSEAGSGTTAVSKLNETSPTAYEVLFEAEVAYRLIVFRPSTKNVLTS